MPINGQRMAIRSNWNYDKRNNIWTVSYKVQQSWIDFIQQNNFIYLLLLCESNPTLLMYLCLELVHLKYVMFAAGIKLNLIFFKCNKFFIKKLSKV